MVASSEDLWTRAAAAVSELKDLRETAFAQDPELHNELKSMIRASGRLRNENEGAVDLVELRARIRRDEQDRVKAQEQRVKAEARIGSILERRTAAVDRREQQVAEREAAVAYCEASLGQRIAAVERRGAVVAVAVRWRCGLGARCRLPSAERVLGVPRRDYTAEEIDLGLTYLVMAAGNDRAAARDLKAEHGLTIPRTTVRDWKVSRADEYAEIRLRLEQRRREAMAEDVIALNKKELEAANLTIDQLISDLKALDVRCPSVRGAPV
jgi:hypothetical protein